MANVQVAGATITDLQLTEKVAAQVGVAGLLGSDGTNLVVIVVPTTDPHVVGHIWNNAGVLTASAG
jgi:hypothetical protein